MQEPQSFIPYLAAAARSGCSPCLPQYNDCAYLG